MNNNKTTLLGFDAIEINLVSMELSLIIGFNAQLNKSGQLYFFIISQNRQDYWTKEVEISLR